MVEHARNVVKEDTMQPCAETSLMKEYRNHRESTRGRRPRSRAPVRKTREENYEETEEENDDHSDVEFIRKAVSNLKKIRFVQEPLKTKKITEDEWKSAVCVQIGDVPAMVEPDTGACVNLIDEHQLKAIKKYSKENIILEKPTVELKTINSTLETIGEFETVIRNKHRGIKTRISVIKGKMDSLPLLCQNTSEKLEFVKTDKEGRLNGSNDLKIKKLIKKPEEQHPECFEGIGCIKDMKNNKEIEVHLEVDKNAIPITQRPRHVAFHLVKPLKEWLEIGVKDEIFEKVPEGEASTQTKINTLP